jgi:hypothetical protein
MAVYEEDIAAGGRPAGEFRDVIVDDRGRTVWRGGWQANLIVNGMRNVLAALMKGDAQGAPIDFWAVGSGDPSWDGGTVPPDSSRITLTQLYTEVTRKPVTPAQITFLGGGFTNRIEITAEFATTDVPGSPATVTLREFGLFSGGSATANSGVLLNHRINSRIDLQAGFTLQRTLRLTF